ncbi:hypothetical protein N7491_010435 [Penicillium cf. griseofulvum]|uniref:SMODS and SLOG-associating 2TM effector domain-containing protein n=1 Tax=Penicillium cf. griseofulvum TaxID=2972120 RepID=A0A9W9MZU8_9EURO|nr:hypothetical protein N7472_000768 [Penicillium cf. griseofulvum]KAJ5421990.1 hypothetical protein N7491_010435 [Penicillium cf. griseofulvum]KAJ5428183.1 hypothetical protein N7445_009637 [Penicillium cf. griseofulvum]
MPEQRQQASIDSSDESQIYLTYEAATAELRKKLTLSRKEQEFQYQLVSIVLNLIAIIQIILGATITALGPSGGEHVVAITILGACNTSVAGLLALLKGRGLPQRLRRNSNEIAKVLDIMQERATLLKYGNTQLSNNGISVLLQEAFEEYSTAQQIIEENQPDTYINRGKPEASVAASDINRFPSQTAGNNAKGGKRRQTDEEMGTSSAV